MIFICIYLYIILIYNIIFIGKWICSSSTRDTSSTYRNVARMIEMSARQQQSVRSYICSPTTRLTSMRFRGPSMRRAMWIRRCGHDEKAGPPTSAR